MNGLDESNLDVLANELMARVNEICSEEQSECCFSMALTEPVRFQHCFIGRLHNLVHIKCLQLASNISRSWECQRKLLKLLTFLKDDSDVSTIYYHFIIFHYWLAFVVFCTNFSQPSWSWEWLQYSIHSNKLNYFFVAWCYLSTPDMECKTVDGWRPLLCQQMNDECWILMTMIMFVTLFKRFFKSYPVLLQ